MLEAEGGARWPPEVPEPDRPKEEGVGWACERRRYPIHYRRFAPRIRHDSGMRNAQEDAREDAREDAPARLPAARPCERDGMRDHTACGLEAPQDRSLALVGMMGSGKSTVGKRLARALGWPFVDMDTELERRCGVPIQTIFELEGEEGFRQRESALLHALCAQRGWVLATGGGVVLRDANRSLLRAHTRVIYLQAALQDLWMRLRHDRSRPLLRAPDPRARVAELLAAREPIYRALADLSVTTGRHAPERVVGEIIERLGLQRLKDVKRTSSGSDAASGEAHERPR